MEGRDGGFGGEDSFGVTTTSSSAGSQCGQSSGFGGTMRRSSRILHRGFVDTTPHGQQKTILGSGEWING
jgi:hypothetical protein